MWMRGVSREVGGAKGVGLRSRVTWALHRVDGGRGWYAFCCL